jgi:hypothetical protein
MKRRARKITGMRILSGVFVVVVIIAGLGTHMLFRPASGAELGYRSLQLSNANAGQTADYALTFQLSNTNLVGSIVIQFCSNDPFPGTACTPPGGFDASGAVLDSQAGMSGFVIDSASTSNQIILSRPPTTASVGESRYVLNSITNPSSPGTYFARVQTFATDDASGAASDHGGIAFQVNNGVTITATVPPYLIFCTGLTITGFNCVNAQGDYIDLGELSSSQSRRGTSQMLVATNASGGYNISYQGTTLTSGNNVIAGITGGDVSRPGTPQFGFNLRANAAPAVGSDPAGPGTGVPLATYGQPNVYRFGSGETLVSNPQPDNLRLFTASYVTNVPSSQSAGVYVSTLTYICLANF